MEKPDSNSPQTQLNDAAVIDNESSRYRLLDLSKLRLPIAIQGPQSGHGPYVVVQRGAMPGDPYSKPLDFLLTKEGVWLPMFAFLKLPEPERNELCIFSTAAEAIHQLETLGGRAMVDAERIARARQSDLSSDRPNKLDAPNGRSQSSTP